MILHKVSTSPFSHLDLQHCLARLQRTDALLLTQDAVYAVMDVSFLSVLSKLPAVYLLQEDANARAIKLENPHFKSINYADFVELSLKYPQVISW
ncbi:sulfurtransferase complex subunit TusB [Paraglaciecola aestuariivivens]